MKIANWDQYLADTNQRELPDESKSSSGDVSELIIKACDIYNQRLSLLEKFANLKHMADDIGRDRVAEVVKALRAKQKKQRSLLKGSTLGDLHQEEIRIMVAFEEILTEHFFELEAG
jgi:hypothetical protein